MKTTSVAILVLSAAFSVSVSHGEPPTGKPQSATMVPVAATTSSAPAEAGKCTPDESRADRLATIDKVIADAKAELEKDPSSIKDDEVRERVGTFAAGAMSDDTLFVSLDRWCWADFYEARKSLEAKNETRAADYAQGWKTCLEASFPERVDLAKPYFSCFPGKPKSKR